MCSSAHFEFEIDSLVDGYKITKEGNDVLTNQENLNKFELSG